ncbi:glycosyl transferase [Nocardioides baekrokdamisoli]|uniref:Glycosyl transferase n=1 Tax=Nocardioides baekrokdamisoli TaxID=1804624 RepID=A0A3G9ITX7_9ACTN|nr:glycosyltransferase [Nocardioides baekrokdamisoli]BBH17081.1 glycosyl transferase [Nocardioides baekrokdamisoli]
MGNQERVVIVHDYLTQRGGAERVTLELMRTFPDARLVTSCWNPATTFTEFSDYDVETLWTNKVRAFRADPRRAFPFLARAFSEYVVEDADVVICSSSGWAHRVTSAAPKLVYCHNPARWLYQPDDYFEGMPGWARTAFAASTDRLRQTDAVAAEDAAAYMVNSSAVARRVHAAYGLRADVLPPPRGLSPEGPIDPIPGAEPGFLLTISRLRGYKHTEQIIAAMDLVPDERLVVVGGRPEWASDRVTVLQQLSDAGLRWLYANASALVAVAHEDFGLTTVEAQAFGTPSVVLRAGGYLDSTIEGSTGVFIDDTSPEAVAAGIRECRTHSWSPDKIRSLGSAYAPEAFRTRIAEAVDTVLGRDLRPQGLVAV